MLANDGMFWGKERFELAMNTHCHSCELHHHIHIVFFLPQESNLHILLAGILSILDLWILLPEN